MTARPARDVPVPLLKAVVPGVVWRIAKNLAASRRYLTSESGSHDDLSPQDVMEAMRGQVRAYFEFGDLTERAIEGREILEVGPGNNLSVGILMLAAGALRVVCIDKFQSRPNLAQAAASYAILHESLTQQERQCCGDVFAGAIPLVSQHHTGRLVYDWNCAIEGAERTLGTTRFDFILSTAVLEHVRSVEAAIRSMYLLLKPGGRMIHRVDLRSHEEDEESHPLDFLTHSSFAWRLMTATPTSRTGNVRASIAIC